MTLMEFIVKFRVALALLCISIGIWIALWFKDKKK